MKRGPVTGAGDRVTKRRASAGRYAANKLKHPVPPEVSDWSGMLRAELPARGECCRIREIPKDGLVLRPGNDAVKKAVDSGPAWFFLLSSIGSLDAVAIGGGETLTGSRMR